jgi:hypothetical protein
MFKNKRRFSFLAASCFASMLLLLLLFGCGKSSEFSPEEISAGPVGASHMVPLPDAVEAVALPELLGSWAMGEDRRGISLRAAGDVVNVGKLTQELGSVSYSLSAWIFPREIHEAKSDLLKVGGGLQTVVSNGALANTGYFHEGLPGFWTALNGDRLVHIMSDNESANIAKGRSITQSTQSIASNVWTHIVVVVDRGPAEVSLYINGVRDEARGDCSFIRTQSALVPMMMGGTNQTGGNLFFGNLSAIKLFDGALNQQQVKSLAAQAPPAVLP